MTDEIPEHSLGDVLVQGQVIDRDGLTKAVEAQKASPQRKRLGQMLVDLGLATLDDVARGLRFQKLLRSRWSSIRAQAATELAAQAHERLRAEMRGEKK